MSDTLRTHLEAEHDVDVKLTELISDTGALILHEGAHTVRVGRDVRPDDASSEHLSSGEGR